ncbi:hypothetical protein A3Q56_07180 [Intoshia linei]|uniref:Uncharacterized protein n=1 Tax=Intoshia linei TaxID=1819745 RepID=A0A177ASV0_9BILA|nr:hypothetical protein A3Q56_07180 [Intoshia linei]
MDQIYECHLSTPVMRCATRCSSDLKMLERLEENNYFLDIMDSFNHSQKYQIDLLICILKPF